MGVKWNQGCRRLGQFLARGRCFNRHEFSFFAIRHFSFLLILSLFCHFLAFLCIALLLRHASHTVGLTHFKHTSLAWSLFTELHCHHVFMTPEKLCSLWPSPPQSLRFPACRECPSCLHGRACPGRFRWPTVSRARLLHLACAALVLPAFSAFPHFLSFSHSALCCLSLRFPTPCTSRVPSLFYRVLGLPGRSGSFPALGVGVQV